jgi:hypothetical protein
MKLAERIRKLFRLPRPHMSRAEMSKHLDAVSELNGELIADLRKACVNGYWRLDHPLSKVCPEHMKTRFPKLTEEEIQIQLRNILGPQRLALVNLAKEVVVCLPEGVRQLPQ